MRPDLCFSLEVRVHRCPWAGPSCHCGPGTAGALQSRLLRDSTCRARCPSLQVCVASSPAGPEAWGPASGAQAACWEQRLASELVRVALLLGVGLEGSAPEGATESLACHPPFPLFRLISTAFSHHQRTRRDVENSPRAPPVAFSWLTGALEATTPAPKNSPSVRGGAGPGTLLRQEYRVRQRGHFRQTREKVAC